MWAAPIWLHARDPMRRIDALWTLVLSSALILALGGTGCASEEDTSDSGEPETEASGAEEE